LEDVKGEYELGNDVLVSRRVIDQDNEQNVELAGADGMGFEDARTDRRAGNINL
jgi:hypothetical protein